MMRRNGGVGKVIGGLLLFFAIVYVIYLYNDLSGQLKNTERTAERYRREQETVSAQLQVQYGHIERLQKALHREKLKYKASLDEMIASKNELKERCDGEKTEMTSRLDSLNKQHKMLKSQHEDMESDFNKLKNEQERQEEEHRKLDEERTLEYNQFKQEKVLEISNLKDAVANLEREKEQLNEDIVKLKTQLQNSLQLVNNDKQTIAQLEQEVQKQKFTTGSPKVDSQKIQNITKVDSQKIQNLTKVDSQNSTTKQQIQQDQQVFRDYQQRLIQAQNAAQFAQQQQIQQQQQQSIQQQQQQNIQQQQQQNVQQQNVQQQNLQNQLAQNNFQPQVPGGSIQQQGANRPLGGQAGQIGFQGFNPVPQGGLNIGKGFLQPGLGNNLNQQQPGVFQQQQQQQQQPQQPVGQDEVKVGGMNIAEEIIQSLKDKHKPVDADEVEEQQKQHQILPPLDPENQGDKNDGQGASKGLHGDNGGAIEDGHDNRLLNQGPVGLQVQEPRLKPDGDNKEGDDGDNVMFRPKLMEPIDNQIQPNQPVDDTIKQEQMEMPVKPMPGAGNQADQMNNLDRDDNLEHEDEDEDDENYDDDYDKDNDNENDKEDY